MKYVVRVEHVAAQSLAVVRLRARQSELGKVVPAACGTVWNALRAQKVTGTGRHVALYHDSVINLEVGVELESPFTEQADVVRSATPSGQVASTTHYGPYQQLHLAHQAIRDYCQNHNVKLAGPSWEVYDHWQDNWNKNPSRIRTDIYYLLIEQPAVCGTD